MRHNLRDRDRLAARESVAVDLLVPAHQLAPVRPRLRAALQPALLPLQPPPV
jgi:hypothetical protein